MLDTYSTTRRPTPAQSEPAAVPAPVASDAIPNSDPTLNLDQTPDPDPTLNLDPIPDRDLNQNSSSSRSRGQSSSPTRSQVRNLDPAQSQVRNSAPARSQVRSSKPAQSQRYGEDQSSASVQGLVQSRSLVQALNQVQVQAKNRSQPLRSNSESAPEAQSRNSLRGRVPLRDGVVVRPVSVAVLAGDPLTGQGAVAHLRTRFEVCVLGNDRVAEAEVVLILVDRITDDTLDLMERVADGSAGREARFVLVGDGVRERHLLRAITSGLVSVIPRREADFDRIVRAIVGVHEGRLEMPGIALGWLVAQLRAVRQDVLEPNGLTPSGLETREVDVLGLLADGLSTGEIAQRLNYSERTVKNIIHGVLTRLKLRNRTHAVAFAVRAGAL
ncbi:MAG TPA: LuxR C-terminal-related transcriptional regulator [Actinocrinis sp.]|nr:LuxR C-terminal-related transcriptional regulator [Actinocrinis sp.]